MFGYLRFILAFLVLLSHVDVRFYGLNPGVMAVVIFYMLAGYVVSHLWVDILCQGQGKLYSFYKDRMLRVLPLYAYVAFLTLAFLAMTNYSNPQFSLIKLIGNFLVIPVNYYMVVDTTILTNPDWCLIPPAWSLGAELQAYLVLPFALGRNKLKIFLAAASFSVYMMANLSVIQPDYFGYRLVFGVFFIFLAGSSLQNSRNQTVSASKFDTFYPWLLWVGIVCLCLIFHYKNLFSPAYTKETFIGILTGIPIIYCLSRLERKGSPIKLPGNSLLGSLSYGVFLSHFLMIWCLDYTGLIDKNAGAYIPAIIIGATLIAWSGVKFIETGIDKIRKDVTVHSLGLKIER
ncbi:MAG: acyltransferase [Deltaproteobacteria bacterium]|nr:acyltransferase [Deltaproteobacteria bacterium]